MQNSHLPKQKTVMVNHDPHLKDHLLSIEFLIGKIEGKTGIN